MADPDYLGFVRFAVGANCPCGGERRITYRKMHHSWRSVPTGCNPPATEALLTVDLQGDYWTRQGPLGAQPTQGIRNLGRYTGTVDGNWLGIGAPELAERIISTDRSATFAHAGNFGTATLSNPYSFLDLARDLDALMASPDAAIGLMPWGWECYGGFREIDLAGGFFYRPDRSILQRPMTPWDGVSWLDGQLADGTIGARAITGLALWRGGATSVTSLLDWSASYDRQLVQASFRGYFTTQQRLSIYRIGSSDVITEAGPVLYWYIEKGLWQAMSPAITLAEALRSDWRVIKSLDVELNRMPPAGQTATEWPRLLVSGGGGC